MVLDVTSLHENHKYTDKLRGCRAHLKTSAGQPIRYLTCDRDVLVSKPIFSITDIKLILTQEFGLID